jgi:hypothetical protein
MNVQDRQQIIEQLLHLSAVLDGETRNNQEYNRLARKIHELAAQLQE